MNQKDGLTAPAAPGRIPTDTARPSPSTARTTQGVRRGDERCDPAFFEQHSVEELARLSDFELSQAGRLTEQMVLRPGATHYAPVSWDEAFAIVGDALRGLASPDEALFYTSGREQRGRVPLPALRASVRHEQPAGLLEHVPRVRRRRSVGDGRHRQGFGDPRGRGDRRLIIVMGRAGTSRPRMLGALKAKRGGTRVVSSTRSGSGPPEFQHLVRGTSWPAAPGSRTSTSRCASTATSRSSKPRS